MFVPGGVNPVRNGSLCSAHRSEAGVNVFVLHSKHLTEGLHRAAVSQDIRAELDREWRST